MMEHVERHCERANTTHGAASLTMEHEIGEFVVGWALKEKIIGRIVSGGYRLRNDDGLDYKDGDATGEDE
jgi:hypothetical protein